MKPHHSSARSTLRGRSIRHAGALLALASIAPLVMSGCQPSLKSGRGFQLPQGNAALGRQAFVDLKCYTCHRVDGVADLPSPTEPADKVVVLGGEVSQTRTYGRLMTSIIHPSQTISEKMPNPTGKKVTESPMRAVNDTMTVSQLINLITFLQPHFRELQPIYEEYPSSY